MAFLLKKNNAKSTLNGDITDLATSLIVSNASTFPLTGDFLITIWNKSNYPDPGDDPDMEILKVTNVSGTTFTVIRGQESTTSKAHSSGYAVELLITVGQFTELENEFSNYFKLDQSTPQTITATEILSGTTVSLQFQPFIDVLRGWQILIDSDDSGGGVGLQMGCLLSMGESPLWFGTMSGGNVGSGYLMWNDTYNGHGLGANPALLMFSDDGNADSDMVFCTKGKFYFCKTITPSVDNTVDLGLTNRRFKDLYLSGDVKNGSGIVKYQGLDATLTALAGLDATTGFVKQTGADTFIKDTNTYLTTAGTATDSDKLDGQHGSYYQPAGTYLTPTTTATRSIILTVEGATANASSGVTFGTLATADSQNYNYAIYNASGISYASWSFVMPDNYDGGTITAKIYWFHPTTTTNYGVKWGVQARALGNGEALTGAWVSSMVEVVDTGGTANYLYISDVTPALTIANTPVAGDLVHLFVQRDPLDTDDTMTVDAYLLRVKLEYGINAYTE